MRALLALTILAGCGAPPSSAASTPASASIGEAPAPDEPEEDEAPTPPAGSRTWLAALPEGGVLSYEVSVADEQAPMVVQMVVQQRVARGQSVAVRLAPVGTPTPDTPVYAQWLVGSPDGLRALEEHAAFTTAGFVPIDQEGRLVTEAASSEVWRVESEWLRADRLASGREAAVGWTLLERVGAVDAPLHANRCVRLEREEGSLTTTLLICADHGLVERRVVREGAESQRWSLVRLSE